MKRTTVYLAFTAFALATILSSCSFLQKGEFADRKYYNFPRSKHTVEQTASVKPEQKKIATEVVVVEKKKQAEPIVSAAVNKKEIVLAENKKSRKVSPPVAARAVEESTKTEPPVHFKKSDIRKAAKKNSKHLTASDAGMMMFLAVIASIFIPPLGVYIKDHRTNKWFWITLLLWVLALFGLGFAGVEFIYTGLSGLFWLTAVVLALLVVFDIL